MSRDLHHNISARHSIAPVSLGATAAGGKTGKIIDRQGYESAEILCVYGAITATNATVNATVWEGDATNSLTQATASSFLGSLSNLGIGATSARASGVSMNVTKRAGYIGKRRYIQVRQAPTVSGGIVAGAEVLLGHPTHAPTTSN